MSTPIKRLVIDVLKPHDPDVVAVAEAVAELPSVDGVNASLIETDREVENVKITIEGDDVDLDAVEDAVEQQSGSVHSVDEVVCGDRVTEAGETPQDR